MRSWTADILMYHSISDRIGPTSIWPETFAEQMEVLAQSGLPVISLDDLAGANMPERAVILTFDDAFGDFATTAWPVLERYGFPATVYVPTGQIGAAENWTGSLNPPRALMDWSTIRRLARSGVTFGNHSVTHPDLTALSRERLVEEILVAKQRLQDELGESVRHFAPPYGKTSPGVAEEIARHHATSVGTDLWPADDQSDLFDLPRLEMYYFRSKKDWKRHLDGHGGAYLAVRRGLRSLRNAISHPAARA